MAALVVRDHKILAVSGLVIAVGVAFGLLEPFGVAILFGTILAVAVRPLRAKLTARGLSPAMASLVLLVSLLVLVLVPILLVAPTLATETRDVFFTVHDHIEKGLPPPAWLASIPVNSTKSRRWMCSNTYPIRRPPYSRLRGI